MENSFSISSPKPVLPTAHPPMQGRPNDHTQKVPLKATISCTIFQKMMSELVGTYILIFIGCGAALVNNTTPLTIVGIPIVWGLAFMATAYAVGHVSGGHFNPAVTIALAADRRLPYKHVPMYVLSQLSGATLASLTLRLLFNDQDNILATMTQYSDSTTCIQAVTWEFIITFILMFTICGVATDDRAEKNMSGIAIGGVFVFNVMVAGPITGASMNPARSFGPATVTGVYKNIWVYTAAPILGALVATMVYSVLRVPEPVKPDDNRVYSQADPMARTLSQV